MVVSQVGLLVSERDWRLFAQGGGGLVLFACFIVGMPPSRWLRHRDLLTWHGWRPVDAVVLRRGLVVDGQAVSVRLPAGHAHVVRRTGRVWAIAGPGVVLLRVDGSRAVFGGRPAASASPERAVAVDRDSFTAARLEVRRLRVRMAVLAFGYAAWSIPWLALVLRPWWVVVVVVGAVCWLLAYAWAVVTRVGPWTWVPAEIDPWKANIDVVMARGWAYPPGQERMRVRLPVATVDFLGAVWEAGGFWVAGEPGKGRFVLGFPDAPLAAIGRFSSARR